MSTKESRANEAERRRREQQEPEYMRAFVVLPLFGIFEVELDQERPERSGDDGERADPSTRADA